MSWDEKLFAGIVLGIVLIVFALGVTGIVMNARSDGQTDYCFINRGGVPERYKLSGHRNWTFDREIGYFDSIEEAKAKADLIGCPVK